MLHPYLRTVILLLTSLLFARQINAQNRSTHFNLSDTTFSVGAIYSSCSIIYDMDGHSYIRPESQPCLDTFAAFMRAHPTMIMEICCYTDQRGNDSFNVRISQQRAMRVKEYLIAHGVAEWSLAAVGYGEKFPCWSQQYIDSVPDKTEKELLYQQNRRTEFRILRAPQATFTFQDSVFTSGSAIFYPMKYALGKGTLDSTCFPFLDSMATFLIAHPQLQMQVAVHTDSRAMASCYKIAQDRAQHVVDYLVRKGVPAPQLYGYGYGETRPIVTEKMIMLAPGREGREQLYAVNRRTEIRIMSTTLSPSK